MDNWNKPVLINCSNDKKVDVAFSPGSPFGKRSVDEHARNLFIGKGSLQDSRNPLGLQYDLLEVRKEEMTGVCRVILLVSFPLPDKKTKGFEVVELPAYCIDILTGSPDNFANVKLTPRIEQEERKELYPSLGGNERFQREYIMYSIE